MGSFIALTSNGEVNLVLAQRAQEEFDPPRVFAVFPENNSPKISQAFTEEFSIKTWSGYINDGQVKLGKTLFKETELSSQQAHLEALIISGELLPLLLRRDNSLQIVTPSETWQAQDELIFLLYDSRPQLLKRLSGDKILLSAKEFYFPL
jgi:Trk K+ transport system NAD-binding subunit